MEQESLNLFTKVICSSAFLAGVIFGRFVLPKWRTILYAFLGQVPPNKSVQRTASPVKAKVVCRNGHERVVEGKDFEDACPKCGADIAEYDSRFGGE